MEWVSILEETKHHRISYHLELGIYRFVVKGDGGDGRIIVVPFVNGEQGIHIDLTRACYVVGNEAMVLALISKSYISDSCACLSDISIGEKDADYLSDCFVAFFTRRGEIFKITRRR